MTTTSEAEERRSQLLDAAERCFERWGVARTSMDDIAEAAGVSRPTLYRHLGDRDSLIREIVRLRSARLIAPFHRHVAQFDAYDDKVTRGLCYLVERSRLDGVVSGLVSADVLAATARMIMAEEGDDSIGLGFADRCWRPILEAGIEAGEFRADLDVTDAVRWIASFTFVLLGWVDADDGPNRRHERIVRDFAVVGLFASID